MSKMNLFWKIVRWMFLGGVVLFVLFIALCFFLIDRKLNNPSCNSAEDVIVEMEAYVEYDFNSEDYEVVDWWCWVFPDVQKGVTLSIKDENAWKDIVKYFKAQKNTMVNDKNTCCKNSTYYDEYGTVSAQENFTLDYKTREIKYSFNDW